MDRNQALIKSDELGLLDGPKTKWADKLIKTANACDRFFNCSYLARQLEEEQNQERCQQESSFSVVDRVRQRLGPTETQNFEVEIYRKLLFEDNEPKLILQHSLDDRLDDNNVENSAETDANDMDIPHMQRINTVGSEASD